MAALLYTASAAICTPNSLSQEVGLGLGAQAGEARLREVFEEAGYTTVPPGRRDAAQPDPRSQAVNIRAQSRNRTGHGGVSAAIVDVRHRSRGCWNSSLPGSSRVIGSPHIEH